MDEKIGVLCWFIAHLHSQELKKRDASWDVIRAGSRHCVDTSFAFSVEKAQTIEHRLRAFVSPREPKKGYTDYYFVGSDRRGWATLLRLVSTEQGLINAEVVMFVQKDDNLLSVGYRFEHPETKGGNNHSYFHAQPIRRSASENLLPPSPSWLPDHSPTFFIPAKSWADLVVYAIHACCGSGAIEKLWHARRLDGYTFLEGLAAA